MVSELLTFLEYTEYHLSHHCHTTASHHGVSTKLHYLIGDLPGIEAYLEKVDQLQKDFHAPPGGDLHPEVCGVKGWTQVKFEYDLMRKAIHKGKSDCWPHSGQV